MISFIRIVFADGRSNAPCRVSKIYKSGDVYEGITLDEDNIGYNIYGGVLPYQENVEKIREILVKKNIQAELFYETTAGSLIPV